MLPQLLVLGMGWTGQYVVKACKRQNIVVAATTTTGRDGTIPFKFDPTSDDPSPFRALPTAQKAVLITFPLLGKAAATRLVDLYLSTRSSDNADVPLFILLGTTSCYSPTSPSDPYSDHMSPVTASPRVEAEDELLNHKRLVLYHEDDFNQHEQQQQGRTRRLGHAGVVLELSGLYDNISRHPSRFLDRIAPSKLVLAAKTSVHYIHGEDVARAILAVALEDTNTRMQMPQTSTGKRWILTDMRVYDWWDLVPTLAQTIQHDSATPYAEWVRELMVETGTRSLPRDPITLGRALDSVAFWTRYSLVPLHQRVF